MSTSRCVELDQTMSFAQTGPEGFAQKFLRAVTKGTDLLLAWQERAEQRAHLATLDDRILRDVGLSRADVQHEVELPFWRSH